MVLTLRRLLIVVAALAVLATACGNSDDDGGDAATDDGGATTTASPDEGDTDTSEPVPTDSAPDDTSGGDGGDTDGGTEGDTFVPIEGVPGVTDEAINFASIALRENNPLGTCIADCYNAGIRAYFDWRNSQGGIFGRELVLSQELDDELSRNQERALEVISDDTIFASFNATLIASGWADLDDAGVPTFVWNIHSESADRQGIFGHFAVGCIDCTQRGVPWAASQAGATTMASLGYGDSENSKVCAQALVDSIDKYQSDLGIEVGFFSDSIAFGMPNGIGPEVSAMKDAGVDFIATCLDLNGMKTLAQELDRQGMGDVVMYHPNTYNQPFVAESEGLFEGDFVVPQFLPFEIETGLEMQDQFMSWMEQSGEELSELAMVGWINADQAYQGILAAGPEFDRQAVIDASNTFTAYDAGGLINPIDWTRQHTPPTEGDPTYDYAQECFSPVRVADNALVPIGEAAAPWLCWDNSTGDWSEPEPTSFGS
ncbi:MAG: ABC transporter substrate-binding protein [Acidimicrobiia bacterium]|nr:ABC transporter substrate-binding protein [Acidimicrobiia bacterium]